MQDLTQIVRQLDDMTGKGEILNALAKFYADDCTFQEGVGEPRRGRAAQQAHLEQFFASLKGFNGATLHSRGVGESVTLSEWTFDMTAGDGSPIVWNEVLVRGWRDGKVISERFYTA